MFFFGDPENQASIYWTTALNALGPELAQVPLDELSIDQLKIALAYARMAYESAQRDMAPDEVLKILLEQHDEIFGYLAQADEEFRGKVLGTKPGRIIWLNGYSAENIAKYKALASAN